MEIKILCPLWGHEHLDITDFCRKIREAGYDGIDTWIPEDADAKRRLFDALQKFELLLVAQQHQAHGDNFGAFKDSFRDYLALSAEGNPLLINSHTGRDYFSFEQNLELIDIAAEFAGKKGIVVTHETHRGRMGFSPAVLKDYFHVRPELVLTTDLSHWVCVTESFLENFSVPLQEAIVRTRHIHARVGFEEGPQVPDPRAPEWKVAVDHFLGWWDRMVESRYKANASLLTFTTEFGPPPYLPTIPFTNQPVADQFGINNYMKDLLRARYGEKYPHR
jgi:sugar phosphate isomerase/epimerase